MSIKLRQWIDQAADRVGKSSDDLLADVRDELGTAAILQRLRSEEAAACSLARPVGVVPPQRARRRTARCGTAHTWTAEFDRIIKYFERAQRARSGILPGPLRVEVDTGLKLLGCGARGRLLSVKCLSKMAQNYETNYRWGVRITRSKAFMVLSLMS